MKIMVNGEEHLIEDGMTVAMLLQELEIADERIAIERNREIVPRSCFRDIGLREGDSVEIVHFVGGG